MNIKKGGRRLSCLREQHEKSLRDRTLKSRRESLAKVQGGQRCVEKAAWGPDRGGEDLQSTLKNWGFFLQATGRTLQAPEPCRDKTDWVLVFVARLLELFEQGARNKICISRLNNAK